MKYLPTVNASRLIRLASPLIVPLVAIILLAALRSMVLAITTLPEQAHKVPTLRTPDLGNSANPSTPQVRPSRGRFLVASRQLIDSQFSKTVVLLVQYDRNGAMGLIINQPTEVKLSKVLPEIEGLQQRPDTIYHGGPVAKNQLMLLIRTESPPEGSHRVLKDIYVSSSQRVIQRMISDPTAKERFRVYAGYAGWAPGQLDQEIARGGWHILRADPETVFDKSPSQIWPELIRRSSAQWVRVLWPLVTVK